MSRLWRWTIVLKDIDTKERVYTAPRAEDAVTMLRACDLHIDWLLRNGHAVIQDIRCEPVEKELAASNMEKELAEARKNAADWEALAVGWKRKVDALVTQLEVKGK